MLCLGSSVLLFGFVCCGGTSFVWGGLIVMLCGLVALFAYCCGFVCCCFSGVEFGLLVLVWVLLSLLISGFLGVICFVVYC